MMAIFNMQLIGEERNILVLIEKWDAVQEQVLRQKSRATWIELGDCNSKYFHAYMRARQARNKVSCIYTEQHVKLSDPKQI